MSSLVSPRPASFAQGSPQAVADYRAALALGDTRPLPELFSAAGETVGGLMTLIFEKLAELEA